MIFIEPILIMPSSKYIGSWHHPEIEDLITDLEIKENCENLIVYTGNIMRIDLAFTKDRIAHVIVMTDDEGMEAMLTETGLNEYAERLSILLNEAVWAPGGNQFALSEYGKIFADLYPMYIDGFACGTSDNVSLATDGEIWWFDEK